MMSAWRALAILVLCPLVAAQAGHGLTPHAEAKPKLKPQAQDAVSKLRAHAQALKSIANQPQAIKPAVPAAPVHAAVHIDAKQQQQAPAHVVKAVKPAVPAAPVHAAVHVDAKRQQQAVKPAVPAAPVHVAVHIDAHINAKERQQEKEKKVPEAEKKLHDEVREELNRKKEAVKAAKDTNPVLRAQKPPAKEPEVKHVPQAVKPPVPAAAVHVEAKHQPQEQRKKPQEDEKKSQKEVEQKKPKEVAMKVPTEQHVQKESRPTATPKASAKAVAKNATQEHASAHIVQDIKPLVPAAAIHVVAIHSPQEEKKSETKPQEAEKRQKKEEAIPAVNKTKPATPVASNHTEAQNTSQAAAAAVRETNNATAPAKVLNTSQANTSQPAKSNLPPLKIRGAQGGVPSSLNFLKHTAGEDECTCAFQGDCTCKGSLAFLDCITQKCASGKCQCQEQQYLNSCSNMATTCLQLDFQCTDTKAVCSVEAAVVEKEQEIKKSEPSETELILQDLKWLKEKKCTFEHAARDGWLNAPARLKEITPIIEDRMALLIQHGHKLPEMHCYKDFEEWTDPPKSSMAAPSSSVAAALVATLVAALALP